MRVRIRKLLDRGNPERVGIYKPCPYCRTILPSVYPSCRCGAVQRTVIAFSGRNKAALSLMESIEARVVPIANPAPSRDEWEALKKSLRNA